jgi:predicted nucleotidyltransferase component of viral defense system
VDFSALYRLQDRVLHAVFSETTEFYLTGGTCLHRFHVAKRYSDDLDLFSNESALFREDVLAALQRLRDAEIEYRKIVDTRDFVRVVVADLLQVDLVNDRVPRYGRSKLSEERYRIDNIGNIFANKVCAVMGRDEPKDVFDLCTILLTQQPNVPELMEAAGRKCVIDPEQLPMRLHSFPRTALAELAIRDERFLEDIQTRFEELIQEIVPSF